MPDLDEDSWSDSSVSSTESPLATTNTMLGFPDGPIHIDVDMDDPQTSHLGGRPSFLPSLSMFPSAHKTSVCLTCERPMELLIQIYAPLEHSLDDRVVYVFGCSRSGCQGPNGKARFVPFIRSIRSFTSRKRNEKYASAHEKRAAKKAAAKASLMATPPPSATANNPFATAAGGSGVASSPSSAFNPFNPFSATPSTVTPASPFGNPFASASPFDAPNPFAPSVPVPVPAETATASSPALAQPIMAPQETTTLADKVDRLDIKSDETSKVGSPKPDPAWKKTPFYPAQYLATQPERLSKPTVSAAQKATELARAEAAAAAATTATTSSTPSEDTDLEISKGKGKGKAQETDEKDGGWDDGTDGNGLDDVLDRFLNRLSLEPEQVIRYDLHARPLFYSSLSPFYALLHPPSSASSVVPPMSTVPRRMGRTYDPSNVPRCETCRKPRSFELQLVPGLLNTLKPETIVDPLSSSAAAGPFLAAPPPADGQTEKSRQELLQNMLAKTATNRSVKTGMEWGSVCVFSCTTDGCGGDWAEEWVGIEWEE